MKKPIAERLLATLCVISLFFLSVPVASAAPAIWILVPAAFMRAVSSVSTTSAPFPLITKDLSLMSTGSEVVALQQFLINKSLLKVSAPTGFYGPLTESAVRRWQSGHAIHPTGTVGPVTRLSIALSATAPSATAVTGSSVAANSADDGANSAASSTPASDSSAFSVVAGGATAVAVSARHSSAPRTTSSTVSASAPTVASTSPANGATNVAYDRGVIVYFSEAMDSSTINSSSFQVSAGGSAVSGAFVYHPLQKAVVFYPYANFSPNTTVSVSLSTDIKDTSGNALANAYSMSYTTGSSASASSTVSLGTASSYGVVVSTINNTDPTKVTGDLAATYDPNGLPGTVTGTSHVNDSTAVSVQSDSDIAALDQDAYACSSVTNSTTDIGGLTFTPGTYCYKGNVTITGTTTLSGSGDYVFKIQGSLTANATSTISVVNGANPNSAYWDAQGSVSLNSGSKILGRISSRNTVNLTNATVAGAVLAQEATLNTSSSSIAVPGSVYCTLTLPVHVRTFTAFQEHDGSWPTAAYIATDGATVTGEVNAQACDFAVYVQPNAHVTIQNATIHDANQVGVFDDGAAVTLSTSTIYNIGDHVGDGKTGGAFSLGGTQTGFGIYVATSSTMTANGNTIYNYQKAGILARVLAGVFFRNNTITGAGPTNALAQIGVQLGFPDAVVASTTIGNFTGNTVTGNYYSPSTDAAGLLGSMVSGENATTLTNTASSTNTINNNQTGQDIVIF